jgi:NADH:ubiquinone oxidoreductase subunit
MGWFLTELFTWWNGQTMGTRWFTRRKGEKVGTDEFGNTYYRTPDKACTAGGFPERRWVVYNGYAEASAIPAGWHGWMHHRVENPPSQTNYTPRAWQKPHQANLTGSAAAYRPKGSIVGADQRPRSTGDYEAWTPQ